MYKELIGCKYVKHLNIYVNKLDRSSCLIVEKFLGILNYKLANLINFTGQNIQNIMCLNDQNYWFLNKVSLFS